MTDTCCATKYPIVLVHGAGFRDLKWPLYWGRIPNALTDRGARVYYGLQDAWGSVEDNARALLRRIDEIRAETGAEKVNLIAHSKGGLEARMAASSLGGGKRIASITMVATPHHGSITLDRLLQAPDALFSLPSMAVNCWIRLLGDKKPDFLRVCREFTTEHMAAFNAANPDVEGVYYQNCACVMRRPFADINLSTANWVVGRIEGSNDGLVTVESATWGEHTRLLGGLSHLDAIDLRRRPLRQKKPGDIADICRVYIELVEELAKHGL